MARQNERSEDHGKHSGDNVYINATYSACDVSNMQPDVIRDICASDGQQPQHWSSPLTSPQGPRGQIQEDEYLGYGTEHPFIVGPADSKDLRIQVRVTYQEEDGYEDPFLIEELNDMDTIRQQLSCIATTTAEEQALDLLNHGCTTSTKNHLQELYENVCGATAAMPDDVHYNTFVHSNVAKSNQKGSQERTTPNEIVFQTGYEVGLDYQNIGFVDENDRKHHENENYVPEIYDYPLYTGVELDDYEQYNNPPLASVELTNTSSKCQDNKEGDQNYIVSESADAENDGKPWTGESTAGEVDQVYDHLNHDHCHSNSREELRESDYDVASVIFQECHYSTLEHGNEAKINPRNRKDVNNPKEDEYQVLSLLDEKDSKCNDTLAVSNYNVLSEIIHTPDRMERSAEAYNGDIYIDEMELTDYHQYECPEPLFGPTTNMTKKVEGNERMDQDYFVLKGQGDLEPDISGTIAEDRVYDLLNHDHCGSNDQVDLFGSGYGAVAVMSDEDDDYTLVNATKGEATQRCAKNSTEQHETAHKSVIYALQECQSLDLIDQIDVKCSESMDDNDYDILEGAYYPDGMERSSTTPDDDTHSDDYDDLQFRQELADYHEYQNPEQELNSDSRTNTSLESEDDENVYYYPVGNYKENKVTKDPSSPEDEEDYYSVN